MDHLTSGAWGKKYSDGSGHVEFGVLVIHPRGRLEELRGEDCPADIHLLAL